MKKLLDADSRAAEKLKETAEKLATEKYQSFLAGVDRYRHSTFRRALEPPPVLWREGTTRLLDFGGKGETVLVIPSLINRYHVLDLDKAQSFARALKARGFRPLVLDWNTPGKKERGFMLDQYIKRAGKALDLAHKENKGPVAMIGYCMGGLLAAALAQLSPGKTKSLMFLATPWDFHADGLAKERMEQVLAQLGPSLEKWNEMPADVLQAFFILLQPFAVIEKFCRFAALDKKSPTARSFVILEDWVNDGVPLAKKVAQECLQGWYVENSPALGQWKVMGECIRPAKLDIPSLHVIPNRDKIVPPASAQALAKSMKDAKILNPVFGHVSMVAHEAAKDRLWPQLFDWLASGGVRP
ncbi:MAG: alpha/beta fold hydrolase [Proteobacteria bacterium]|nr:alpha/beta fold hydrolase [Pseudomonadota bacterium]